MSTTSPHRANTGFTLIELVIAIVVIGVGVAGVFAAVITATSRSVDPLIQTQGAILARSYVEEILLRDYSDPDGADGECAAGRPRHEWDDVDDYACLDGSQAVTDQRGNALPGLANYRVAVAVTGDTLAGRTTRRIEVAITHTTQSLDLRVVAHRADL